MPVALLSPTSNSADISSLHKGSATNLKMGGQGGNTVKAVEFEKRWEFMTPSPSSYSGVAPDFTLDAKYYIGLIISIKFCL